MRKLKKTKTIIHVFRIATGNHAFDKEKHGGRFYCLQHFGLIGTVKSVRADYKKISTPNKENIPISYAMASRMQDKVFFTISVVLNSFQGATNIL